ncbi:MAG TPA: hemerythrin domain-containing protein [Verrucomicrobiae bacterium]|nr:hemerythrin domain-containing protein [Verrucomicrobiae bacterium]
MITWTERFETGDALVDQQHQELIDNINYLECLLNSETRLLADFQFLIRVIEFLERYAADHFSYEERCMEWHRCPVHLQNQQAHGEFLAFFQRFKERWQREGFRTEIVRELHEALSHWIEGHICQVDLQLRPCLGHGLA